MTTKKKKLLAFFAAIILLADVFYFTDRGVVIKNAFNSLVIGFTRTEKRIVYTAGALLPFRKKPDVILRVPFHKQEHALSCEIAALTMVLNYRGIAVTESELLRDLPFSATTSRSKDNIWGDPNNGFVGDIDGKMPNLGYGVYEQPIVDLALQYRDSKKLENASLEDVLAEVARGHPVIVWGTSASGRDASWQTPEGKYIRAIYGEHTRVVIGYNGAQKNPQYIVLLDPIYGQITMSKNKLLENWALLGNKAVVVY